MSLPTPLRAIVIGAGIGGLTAGIALRRVGIDATVFDRARDVNQIQVGTGIHMWPNAMKVLRELGVADEVEAAGARVERSPFSTWRGELLREMRIGDVGRKIGESTIGIRRADLHRILVDALDPSALALGREFARFEQDAGGVTVRFADGGEERADVLVGADGVNSAVRAQLLGAAAPKYDSLSWLGIVDFEDESTPLDSLSVIWGAGRGFVYFSVGGTKMSWIANVNVPSGTARSTVDPKASVLAAYRGWAHPIEALVNATDEGAIHGQEIFDRRPTKRWSEGRVSLLGDAAHPMIPMISQGACQAIEDAFVLARCLRAGNGVAEALAEYERLRISRTAGLQKRGRLLAAVGRWKTPLACAFRDKVFIKRLGPVAERLEEDTFAYDATVLAPFAD